MTSAPVRAASAAVTELSTPPDMATTTLACRDGIERSKLTGICRRLYPNFTPGG
jgi:hypothetical protein